MPIDPRISLGVQSIQLTDPLAQYGQEQNILAAQAQRKAAGTQNQLAQETLERTRLENQDIQQARDVVSQIMTEAKKNGAPTNDPFAAGMQMLQHPNPKVQVIGQHLVDATQKIVAYQQDQAFINRNNPQTAAPAGQAAGMSFAPGALGSGTFDPNAPNQLAPMPAVAPTAAPTVNQLATQPQMSKADQLMAEIRKLRTQFPYSSRAKEEAEILTKQWEALSKPHVVGRNLVSGAGENIFTSPQDITPSDIKRLTTERDALPLGHPNRRLYDQAIANIGSSERLAQERLNFDRDKFAWEKANPGYTIQQTENGEIVGVNNRSLQAFPVTLGGAAPPPAAPFAPGQVGRTVAPAPGGAGKRGGAVVPGAEPIIQPRGEPVKGKSSGLTESQGNATAFGMRMKDSHAVLKDLENKGETNTGLVRGAVGGTVGLVPLIGEKLTGATDNIFNVLPSILGGMSTEQQQIQNARINFITAVLRKESGAAISPGEFITAEKLYFPQPGNDATVIKQKQKARELAIQAMKIQAGPGAKSIESTMPNASGKSASDPLGLFKK